MLHQLTSPACKLALNIQTCAPPSPFAFALANNDLDSDSPFNECGECQCTHDVDINLLTIQDMFDMSTDIIINTEEVIEAVHQPRSFTASSVDFEA